MDRSDVGRISKRTGCVSPAVDKANLSSAMAHDPFRCRKSTAWTSAIRAQRDAVCTRLSSDADLEPRPLLAEQHPLTDKASISTQGWSRARGNRTVAAMKQTPGYSSGQHKPSRCRSRAQQPLRRPHRGNRASDAHVVEQPIAVSRTDKGPVGRYDSKAPPTDSVYCRPATARSTVRGKVKRSARWSTPNSASGPIGAMGIATAWRCGNREMTASARRSRCSMILGSDRHPDQKAACGPDTAQRQTAGDSASRHTAVSEGSGATSLGRGGKDEGSRPRRGLSKSEQDRVMSEPPPTPVNHHGATNSRPHIKRIRHPLFILPCAAACTPELLRQTEFP